MQNYYEKIGEHMKMTTEEKIYMVLAALERIDRRFVFLPIEEIKQCLTNEWLDFYVWFFCFRNG